MQDETLTASSEIDPDEQPVWALRGIKMEIRRRMKSIAALRGQKVPEVVEDACLFWIANEMPEQ